MYTLHTQPEPATHFQNLKQCLRNNHLQLRLYHPFKLHRHQSVVLQRFTGFCSGLTGSSDLLEPYRLSHALHIGTWKGWKKCSPGPYRPSHTLDLPTGREYFHTECEYIMMRQNNRFSFDIGGFKIKHQTVTAVVRN